MSRQRSRFSVVTPLVYLRSVSGGGSESGDHFSHFAGRDESAVVVYEGDDGLVFVCADDSDVAESAGCSDCGG